MGILFLVKKVQITDLKNTCIVREAHDNSCPTNPFCLQENLQATAMWQDHMNHEVTSIKENWG